MLLPELNLKFENDILQISFQSLFNTPCGDCKIASLASLNFLEPV
jgi:hypothetical protein